MSTNKIDLCNDVTAYLTEDGHMFKCNISWLSRSIEVSLSSGDYGDEKVIEGMKRTFERFWTDKESYLDDAKSAIKARLLPYIATHDSRDPDVPYPEVSEEIFEAEYWLDSIMVVFDDDASFVQMNFDRNGGDKHYDEFCALVNIDREFVTFFVGDMPIDIEV